MEYNLENPTIIDIIDSPIDIPVNREIDDVFVEKELHSSIDIPIGGIDDVFVEKETLLDHSSNKTIDTKKLNTSTIGGLIDDIFVGKETQLDYSKDEPIDTRKLDTSSGSGLIDEVFVEKEGMLDTQPKVNFTSSLKKNAKSNISREKINTSNLTTSKSKKMFKDMIRHDFVEKSYVEDIYGTLKGRRKWKIASDVLEALNHILIAISTVFAFAAGFFKEESEILTFVSACLNVIAMSSYRLSVYSANEFKERTEQVNEILNHIGVEEDLAKITLNPSIPNN